MKSTAVSLIAVIALLSLFQGTAVAAVKAFPTAEGFGANALGGRGGAAQQVTTLDDSGTGASTGGEPPI